MAKSKVTDNDIYSEWHRSGSEAAVIAKKLKTTVKRVNLAIKEGVEEFAANTRGEMSVADPLNMFGGRFSITPYNPDALVTRYGMRIFDQMREDDQIHAASLFKKHTILSAGYEIVSPEGQAEDWEVTEFVTKTLEELDGSFQTTLIQIMTAMDYGYSVTEKIYDDADGMINLRALKTRKPHSFDFKTDEHGNIAEDGLWQRGTAGASAGGYTKLPIDKFVIYTHQFEFGNHYGKSDFIAAYRPWWSKDNAYKFLMMVLERYGVPTILAMYDPKKYSPAHIDKLYSALKSMSSTTMGVIPRSDPDNLELWSPENLAKNAKDVFGPTLDMFNRDIARAILMPGLLGLTPDQQAGSFARARVQFDVFMLVVEYLRSEIQEKVMMDQIIKPLVNLNFTTDVYPGFRFLPLTDDIRLDILGEWREQLAAGGVKSRPTDENRVRDLLDFEELDQDEMDERNAEPDEEEDESPDPSESPDDESPEDIATREAVESFAIHSDAATIEKELDRVEKRGREQISAALIISRNALLKHVEKNFKLQSEFPMSIKGLRKIDGIKKAVEEFVLSTYQLGRTTLRREVKAFTNNEVKWYDDPNYKPSDAMRHLQQKSLWVTGVIEDDLVDEARLILLNAVETGQPLRATMETLGAAFDPFVGITVDGEVVSAHRLETIIRTNATDAFNTGRLLQARQAGPLLKGFEYSSILDGRTTDVCRFLDGKNFKAGDGNADQLKPPRHFNCRSYLIPIPASANVDKYISASEVARGLSLSHKGF